MADLPDLGGLVAAIDTLCGADPAAVGDGETVVLLLRQVERLSAVATRAVGVFDRGGEWAEVGARSSAAFLSTERRLPKQAVQRRVRLARDLLHLPVTEAAWLAGDINQAQVSLLAAARTPTTAEAMARDEAMLVADAATLRHDRFCRVLDYWRHLNDEDGTDKQAQRDRDRRRVHLSPGMRGTGFLDGLLDPLGYAILSGVLHQIEQQLFEADWAEAKHRLGRDPAAGELRRTPAQRRHDALVEMARRAAAMPPEARKPDPLFVVLVDYHTFAGRVCELANGAVLTPGSLVPWLTQADIERAVFGPANRPINLGRRSRLFTGATRRAVQLRDLECYHPYCDVPAQDCEIDHIQPFAAGGPTIDTNGRCACGFHNRLRQKNHNRDDEPPGSDAP